VDTQLTDLFDAELRIPAISTLPSLEYALKEMELFQDRAQLKEALLMLSKAGFGQGDEYDQAKHAVGIKKLVSIVEMARQEPDAIAERLVSSILGLGSY
jgi:vesicle-fusing ATPase